MVNTPTTLEPLRAEEEDFLRALARALIFLPRAFVADLGREHGLSMSEYFVMMYLSESPQRRLRMGELAAQTALSLPAVTRLVKQLESKGLLARQAGESDRRVHEAMLTDAGLARLALALPGHVASVRGRILDKIGDVDLRAGTALLERLCEVEPQSKASERRPT